MTRPPISLENFYREWLAWVDSGAPDRQPFARSDPLWVCTHAYPNFAILTMELFRDFYSRGLITSPSDPFGPENYSGEVNPRTIAWVRSRIQLPSTSTPEFL